MIRNRKSRLYSERKEEEEKQEERQRSTSLTLLFTAWSENITLLREEREEGGRTKGRLESCN